MEIIRLAERLGWAWKAAFWPASLLYGQAVRARAAAYRWGWLETVRLPVPVFCLGNITVGGSGKTPGAIWLAEYLLKKGRRPAVISRGYGARSKVPIRVVSDGAGKTLPVSEAGDEPLLIALRLPSVPVLAGADRSAVGRRAVEEFGADALIMDDGFQHLRLFRNVNILCLDTTEVTALFERGGAALLPAGRLREPLSALWRADIVLLTRAEGLAPSKIVSIRRKVEDCLLDVPVVPVFGALSLWERAGGEEVLVSSLKGRPVLAVSGLARPESFEAGLRRLGMKVKPLRFSDHHLFTPDERERIISSAKADGRRIVVTEKDAVRLPADFPCLVARLEWSPQETKAPQKGDITPYARTVPWTQRIDSVIS